jgi:hypothetical protein
MMPGSKTTETTTLDTGQMFGEEQENREVTQQKILVDHRRRNI